MIRWIKIHIGLGMIAFAFVLSAIGGNVSEGEYTSWAANVAGLIGCILLLLLGLCFTYSAIFKD